MMMAFDQTPTPSLGAATVEALRAALARYAGDGEHSGVLREALRRAAAEAREKGITPERLLILLKDLWHAQGEPRGAIKAEEQRHRLQQLITWCIREYYAE